MFITVHFYYFILDSKKIYVTECDYICIVELDKKNVNIEEI